MIIQGKKNWEIFVCYYNKQQGDEELKAIVIDQYDSVEEWKEKQVLKPGGVSVSIVHEPIQKVKGIKSGFL